MVEMFNPSETARHLLELGRKSLDTNAEEDKDSLVDAFAAYAGKPEQLRKVIKEMDSLSNGRFNGYPHVDVYWGPYNDVITLLKADGWPRLTSTTDRDQICIMVPIWPPR